MKQNFDKKVKEIVEDYFKKEEKNYQKTISDHIKEGFQFEKSHNKIEKDIYQKLDDKKFDSDYNNLKSIFKKLQKEYTIDKFNKALYSDEFQTELRSKNKTLEEFIELHQDYLKEFELLIFHHQNREIFQRYFMIKYDEKHKDKINYEDLKLYRGGRENDGLVGKQIERLMKIQSVSAKNKEFKLEKFDVKLTTRDIAVFMILFKSYYKLDIKHYVEFIGLSKLFFDDLFDNINAGDPKMGTSIDRYLNGKELFTSKFNFESSKEKVIAILSEINLKDFKNYVEKVKISKFKSMLSTNTRF